MKGFKTRVVRPGSARPKTGLIPGITESSSPDFGRLFIESRQKDVSSKQLEFEKSRSKLVLHFEAKKSQDEKDIMARKYEETIKSMNDTHQNRMKALTQQHDMATEALMEQFKREISQLKTSHKSHIDRLLAESEEQNEAHFAQIEKIKSQNKELMLNKEKEYKKSSKKLREEVEKQYQQLLHDQKENLEREKHDFCENAIKDRDCQIKSLINKLYEDCRKEWKIQENKLLEEIRVLKFQIEKFKGKEDGFDGNRPEFNQSDISNIGSLVIYDFDDVKNEEKVKITDLESKKEIHCNFTQTEMHVVNHETQTEHSNEVEQMIGELESLHSREVQDIESKIVVTLNKKNAYIANLESQLQQSIVKTKELEALFRQLKC